MIGKNLPGNCCGLIPHARVWQCGCKSINYWAAFAVSKGIRQARTLAVQACAALSTCPSDSNSIGLTLTSQSCAGSIPDRSWLGRSAFVESINHLPPHSPILASHSQCHEPRAIADRRSLSIDSQPIRSDCTLTSQSCAGSIPDRSWLGRSAFVGDQSITCRPIRPSSPRIRNAMNRAPSRIGARSRLIRNRFVRTAL